jgi:sarcosine oxidase subunit gamma
MDNYVGLPPTAAERVAETTPAATFSAASAPVASRQSAHITACSLVRQLAPAERYILRGTSDVTAAAGKALGLQISTAACRAATNGPADGIDPTVAGLEAAGPATLAALWLGPDEQLLLGGEGSNIAAALGPALGDLPHSLVDVSHRQTALEVSGPEATTLLSTGCPLDLDLASFPVGMCTRTVLAKAEIVLWRTSEHVFHIEVWRSFAAYVSAFLAEAAREIAIPQKDSGDRL